MSGIICKKDVFFAGRKKKQKIYIVVFRNEIELLDREKFKHLKNLTRNILLSHCRGHDTTMVTLNFEDWEMRQIRLYSDYIFLQVEKKNLKTSLKCTATCFKYYNDTIVRFQMKDVFF